MHRFFIPPQCCQNEMIELPDETARQIRRVLRLKEGATIIVLDNSGKEYECEIQFPDEHRVCANVSNISTSDGEPDCKIYMYLALTQREKFEWMLQKCTEAGASSFIPVISERSLVRDKKNVLPKIERWQKITTEAAEQCQRAIIPQVALPLTYAESCHLAQQDLKLFFWEEEKHSSLQSVLHSCKKQPKSIAILVGPEGGFSQAEANQAIENGWQSVSLGKRILRAETAAMASVLLTLYELERD